MNEQYQFKGDDYYSAVLNLLVTLAAKQETMIRLLFDELEAQGRDRGELVQSFTDYMHTARKLISDKLFEAHGSIDLEAILKQNNGNLG